MLIPEIIKQLSTCRACGLCNFRNNVVLPSGDLKNPILLIIGDIPGEDEDMTGQPFIGAAGQALREVLRASKVINRLNTVIMNTIHCRPPKNKIPKDGTLDICTTKWTFPIIDELKPRRILLLGGAAMNNIGNINGGITSHRGVWFNVRGIRSLATFHPSYVIRQDGVGDSFTRKLFEEDIMRMAEEVSLVSIKESR